MSWHPRRRRPREGRYYDPLRPRGALLGATGVTGWAISHRADREAVKIADRHYNRQKVGSPQFVPPGRCIVLRRPGALWVTSWPFAEYVRHAWPGAWINSLFRKEVGGMASDMIRDAIAATRARWQPPALGMVSFVDPRAVPGTMVRGQRVYGHCYQRAGFKHVGFTAGGLWAWQLLPEDMPEPELCAGMQPSLFPPARPDQGG